MEKVNVSKTMTQNGHKPTDTVPMFGNLTPAEAGKKGGRKRSRKKDLDWVRDRALENLPELVRAARGEGKWEDLTSKDRLSALFKLFEYGLGRPTALQKEEKEKEGHTFSLGLAESPSEAGD